MVNLENRIEKLEARVPAEHRPWVRMIFDPKDFGGDVIQMNAAVEKASRETWAAGKQLIARIICAPAVKDRSKYSAGNMGDARETENSDFKNTGR